MNKAILNEFNFPQIKKASSAAEAAAIWWTVILIINSLRTPPKEKLEVFFQSLRECLLHDVQEGEEVELKVDNGGRSNLFTEFTKAAGIKQSFLFKAWMLYSSERVIVSHRSSEYQIWPAVDSKKNDVVK